MRKNRAGMGRHGMSDDRKQMKEKKVKQLRSAARRTEKCLQKAQG
jgi:hypothetical protein